MSKDLVEIIKYTSNLLELPLEPQADSHDINLTDNSILDDWLISRTDNINEMCKENDCDVFSILEMLEQRSYEKLEKLESQTNLNYPNMKDVELKVRLRNNLDRLRNFEAKYEHKYGSGGLLLQLQNEISNIFAWNTSRICFDQTMISTVHSCIELNEYIKKLHVLSEYANLLTTRIIRKNLENISSRSYGFSDLMSFWNATANQDDSTKIKINVANDTVESIKYTVDDALFDLKYEKEKNKSAIVKSSIDYEINEDNTARLIKKQPSIEYKKFGHFYKNLDIDTLLKYKRVIDEFESTRKTKLEEELERTKEESVVTSVTIYRNTKESMFRSLTRYIFGSCICFQHTDIIE